jgi:MSHA biogenesis protein MshJ
MMQAKLKALLLKVDALSMRERLLIFVAILVALFQGWDSLVWRPIVQQQDQMVAQEIVLDKEMLQMQIDLKILTAKASQDPDKDIKQQIANLQKQLAAVNGQIKQSSESLVSPEEMSRLLEDMLTRQNGLELLSLQTHDSVPLIKPAKDEPQEIKYQIYRHGFSIEFRGGYMATLKYLEALLIYQLSCCLFSLLAILSLK